MNEKLLLEQRRYLSEKLKNSVIAVSGATGLIGSRIASYLFDLNDNENAGITVIVCYRDKSKYEKVYSEFTGRDDIKPVFFDTDTVIEGIEHIDYAVHCAGISGGSKMHLKDPVKVFEVAYYGTKAFLDFSVKSGCKKFCYVSTYEIYGTPDDGHLLKENEPCVLDTAVLRNIYSECKRMCESMCTAYSAKYGLDVVCGRLTSTFGNGVSYNDPRFFAEFARCAVKNKDIILKSSGGTIRSYLDSDDAATAFLYLLTDGSNLNIYNITNMDNKISIREIAEKVIKLSGTDAEVKFDISDDVAKLGYRQESVTLMDSEKLYSIGWSPAYEIDDTIVKLINEMRKNGNEG